MFRSAFCGRDMLIKILVTVLNNGLHFVRLCMQ